MDAGTSGLWPTALDADTVERTAAHYNLGSADVIPITTAGEWGYSFFLDPPLGNGGFALRPTTRAKALNQLKAWVKNFYALPADAGWQSMTGHYLWQHYAAEWGCGAVGSEVGETISSTQSHIAFSRGAAKQYGIPWSLQFSFWHQGYINDYTGLNVWGSASTATGGHSASLYRRTFLAAYMGGASHFYPEAGSTINFYNEKDADGYYRLSPIGSATRELVQFTENNPDVGINLIPFGLVIDHDHGMYSGDTRITDRKVFGVFDYTAGDTMTENLLNLFFPGSFGTIGCDESTYQVNGPFGDTCDVLLQNASAEVLNSYPCLVLSGDLTLSAAEADRYTSYVRQGGTLILNTAFLPFFTAYKNQVNGTAAQTVTDGEGKVIVYGPDYSLDGLTDILKAQLKEYLPVSVDGDAEYMVNIRDGAVMVTLMNNDGYYFNRAAGEYKDETQTHAVTVNYLGRGEVKQIRELLTDTPVGSPQPNRRACNVTLNPGEVKIIAFYF